MQAFAFHPVRHESSIFRFECINVESEETEASNQIPHPLWVVIKCLTPEKTKFIKFPSSRQYARGDF